MKHWLTSLALACVLPASLEAQQQLGGNTGNTVDPDPGQVLLLDLSVQNPGDSVLSRIQPGRYTVRVTNLVPGGDYVPLVRVGRHEIEPLSIPTPGTTKAQTITRELRTTASTADPAACEALRRALTALRAHQDEKTVAAEAERVDRMSEWTTCGPPAEALWTEFTELRLRMNRYSEVLTVRRGEYVHVTLARTDVTRRWVRVWDTGRTGEWRTTYGFSFIQYLFNADRRYFLRPATDPTSFVIVREDQRNVMEFAPTLFFTWSASDSERPVVISPTVGLGFDFERPTLSVGAAFTYRENISLNAGVTLHHVHRLNGQFKEGDTIKENLTFDALHQSVYRPNPFIAVSVRSLSNPFARPEQR